MQTDSVEVVVVTHNSAGHIGPCVESIVAAGACPIIVDNGSTDDTLEIVRSRCPEAKIIAASENLGYGKAMNLGFRETNGDLVILSNPDVVFLNGSIRQLVGFLEKNPRVGVAGPQLVFPNRSWQRSYGDLPGIWAGIKDAVGITTLHNAVRRALWPWGRNRRPKRVPYVDGAVLAVRRRAFLEMGGFDENFYFYSDESDLCARLKRSGWGVVFFPEAQAVHIRGADSAKVDRSDRFVRYMVKSQSLLACKHLPPWKARIYTKLQVCHFARLGLMYRLLQWFRVEKSTSAYKIWLFDAYARIWKEFYLCPQLIRTPSNGKATECKELGKTN